ncbi:MAG: ACP S-malonyltransferase [Dehalococcoidia bacterium]
MANSQPPFLPEATDPCSAWLFPGQGAQEVGMGRDLCRDSAAARLVFETADAVLGYALSEICFAGPEERLRDTEYAQPAIFTTSLASLAAAVECGAVTTRPGFMAGHSLGEYSALVAAGALTLEDGLVLLQQRARLMAEAGRQTDGTLAAILGLDDAVVRDLCRDADVDVCNMNLPTQTVIGGARENVVKAIWLAKERGASRALELNVSGAFHSRLMKPAVTGLTKAVSAAKIASPGVPVVANASATVLADANAVRHELVEQIASPVRWHESVTLMATSDVTSFTEFGPGKVLSGLVKRLTPGARIANIGSMADIKS